MVLLPVPSVPHPLISGGHLRDWQILNLLNRVGIRPHLLYFGAGEKYQLDSKSPVHEFVSGVTFGGHRAEDANSGMVDAVVRKLRYFNSNTSIFPYSHQYDEIGAGSIIKETAQRINANVVILRNMWCHYTEDLRPLGCKVIVNCPDFNTALAGQLLRAVRSPLNKIGPALNYAAVRKQERKFLPRCDEIWVPTRSEAADISEFANKVEQLILPNLVDVSRLPNLAFKACASPNSLLFVANFGYLPNANGARRLLQVVMPKLRRRRPDVELVLAGAGLQNDLKALASKLGGVQVTGFVPSLEEYYQKAAIVLLPVREGAGMLFKALEALALGKPTVGYRESFRGISDADPRAFISVDSDEEMADSILQMLADDSTRQTLAMRARAHAEANLSWEFGAKVLAASHVLC